MKHAAHTFLGAVVLLVLAGAVGSIVLLAWMAGSYLTEFPHSPP